MANWRGAWNSGTAYAAGDSASYGGTNWYCLTANTGQAPSAGTYWTPMDSYTGGTFQVPPGGEWIPDRI